MGLESWPMGRGGEGMGRSGLERIDGSGWGGQGGLQRRGQVGVPLYLRTSASLILPAHPTPHSSYLRTSASLVLHAHATPHSSYLRTSASLILPAHLRLTHLTHAPPPHSSHLRANGTSASPRLTVHEPFCEARA
eukprot:354113-Chlamydomonas_euryale.AAC.3